MVIHNTISFFLNFTMSVFHNSDRLMKKPIASSMASYFIMLVVSKIYEYSEISLAVNIASLIFFSLFVYSFCLFLPHVDSFTIGFISGGIIAIPFVILSLNIFNSHLVKYNYYSFYSKLYPCLLWV